MILHPEGERIIRRFETCQLTAYPDLSGRPTIGYGYQGWDGRMKVTLGMTITKEKADELFHHTINLVCEQLDTILRVEKVELENDWQYTALVSLLYNKGPGTFRRSEVLLHLKNTSERWHMIDAMVAFTQRRIEVHPVTKEPIPRLDWKTDKDGNEIEWRLGLARRRVVEAAVFDRVLDPARFDE